MKPRRQASIGLSAVEAAQLRALLAAARRLDGRLRRFAASLPPAGPRTAREIARARLECIAHDRLSPAIADLESTLAEVEGEPAPPVP